LFKALLPNGKGEIWPYHTTPHHHRHVHPPRLLYRSTRLLYRNIQLRAMGCRRLRLVA